MRRLAYQPFETGTQNHGRWNGIELFTKLTGLISGEEKLFIQFHHGVDNTSGVCFSTAQDMLSLIRDARSDTPIIFGAVLKSEHQHL